MALTDLKIKKAPVKETPYAPGGAGEDFPAPAEALAAPKSPFGALIDGSAYIERAGSLMRG